MIPKIIHACWFGGNPLTDEYAYYIEGWKKRKFLDTINKLFDKNRLVFL